MSWVNGLVPICTSGVGRHLENACRTANCKFSGREHTFGLFLGLKTQLTGVTALGKLLPQPIRPNGLQS